jgi:hypothetical protein
MMLTGFMADLEELAIKRDRGYLVRLVLLLAAAVIASAFLWHWLAGAGVGGCMADAFLGQQPAAAGAAAKPR